jgi:hypothetical protein
MATATFPVANASEARRVCFSTCSRVAHVSKGAKSVISQKSGTDMPLQHHKILTPRRFSMASSFLPSLSARSRFCGIADAKSGPGHEPRQRQHEISKLISKPRK